MGYKLKILSPVHVGCGDKYTGLNFILDDKRVYVVEPEAIINLLDDEKNLKFAQWLDVNSNEIARLDQARRNKKRENPRSEDTRALSNELRKKKRDFTLTTLVNEKKLVTLEQLKSKAVYSISAQDGIFKDSEISPFIRQTRLTYIPGTELKGAIRTSILYCALQDDESLQNWLQHSIESMLEEAAEKQRGQVVATFRDYISSVKNQKRPDLRKKNKKNKLVERVKKIESQFQDKVLNSKIDMPDAKYDVMKFLQVGDSALLGLSDMAVAKTEPFKMSNRFPIVCEYLRPDITVPLTSFKLDDERSRDTKLDKMQFTARHKQLMTGLDSILACCHRFAADLLEEEIAYFTKHDKANIVEHLRKIQRLNTPDVPVLRIGKDEGYTSLTVGLAVKKLMPDLYENVLIHATKNKSYDSSITRDNYYFPKSRKIVHWNGKEMTAGWVQLIPVSSKTQDPEIEASAKDKKDMPQTKQSGPVDLSGLAVKFNKTRR